MRYMKTLRIIVGAGTLVLTVLAANADSITLGNAGQAPTIGGGSDWTYQYTFANSFLRNGSYFTINDFGPASSLGPLFDPVVPSGSWVMSQALSGPNSRAAVDDPSLLNVTFTWAGSDVAAPDGTFTFILHSPLDDVSGQARSWTSYDIVASQGSLPVSRILGHVMAPSAVPDGGITAVLLGGALSALMLLRRKVAL